MNDTERSNFGNDEKSVMIKKESQNILALDSTLKTLLEFKDSLLDGQKIGDSKIQGINEQIEETKKRIDEERQSLEGLRIKLKEINDEKGEEFPKFMELKDRVIKSRDQRKHDEQIGPKSNKERINVKQLTRSLEQLEKDIQTKKLSKDEERRLVARSKEIATKLHSLKAFHKQEDEYRTISSQYNSLKDRINVIFDKRSEFGNKIGQLKKVLDTLLDTRENLYEERRKIVREVREIGAKLEMVNTQINAIEFRKSKINLSANKKRFRNIHDKNYSVFRNSKDRAIKNKENIEMWKSMKEQALKKMSSGEKLTFDEMRLIYSDINTSETA